MARKTRTKKATNDNETRVRRKFTPWDTDRVTPESPSSLEVLMAWLANPGNVDQWRRDKNTTCREICQALQANGIYHREMGDVQYKIRYMHNQFVNATARLHQKKEMEAFQRDEAHPEIVEEVLKICPQYRELLPCFGKNIAASEVQGTVKSADNGAATAKSNGTTTNKSAAGEWKKNLEKDMHKAVTEEKTRVNGEKVVEKSGVNGIASTVQKAKQTVGDKKAGSKAEQNRTKENGAEGRSESASAVVGNGQRILDTTKDTAKRNAAGEDKTDNAGENDKNDEVGQHNAASTENEVRVEEKEGVLADSEDSQSDADEGKQSSDDEEEEGADTMAVQEDAQADAESEDESSEEEVKPPSRVGVRSPFKTKPKQSESEESSSEEEDSDEEKSDSESESEQEEGDDGEERIPLAQLDEVDEATPTEVEEEEQVEQTEIDEVADGEVEADEGEREKVEESEETEEEAEEVPEQDNFKGAVDSSEDSDDNSSESESEDAEKDEEVPPTQVKAPSDHEEESEDESKNEENDGKAEMAEDTHNLVDQSDPDVEMAVEQSSDVESESPSTEQSTRKRSSSNESSSPTTKRTRRDRDSNDATRDLEREAFIERAKQERDQRDELFKLERAKLECELQAKQVQLAMERSLARKKLLGAGIDPKEVDRVLPL